MLGTKTIATRSFSPSITNLPIGDMVIVLWTLLFMGCVRLAMAEDGGRKSGPYNIEIEKFITCDDVGTGEVHMGTKISKSRDGKYLFNNPFYLGHPMDQHYKMHVEVQSLGNGGYRPRYMQHTMQGCEAILKHFKDALTSFMKSAGVAVVKCPIPAGNYTSKDFELGFHLNNIPVMLYNKYRAILTSYYKEVKVACLMVYAEVVPK